MSETEAFDLASPYWKGITQQSIWTVFLARWDNLHDQYLQETEGYTSSSEQWLSASGEGIDDIRRRYPYEIWGETQNHYCYERMAEARMIMNRVRADTVGRRGICIIEGICNPDEYRVRIALKGGDYIAIELAKPQPDRLQRIIYGKTGRRSKTSWWWG